MELSRQIKDMAILSYRLITVLSAMLLKIKKFDNEIRFCMNFKYFEESIFWDTLKSKSGKRGL